MKVVLICSLLAVLALAKPRDVKKVRSVKHVSGGHDAEILNKLKEVTDDAHAGYSYNEIAHITKAIKKKTREASDKHNLQLEPEIQELEKRILAINDADPRGSSYNVVLAQAEKIYNTLAAHLSDDELAPFSMEYLLLKLLARNTINKRIARNLKKLKLNLSELIKKLSQAPLKPRHQKVDLHSRIEHVLALLSKPSLSKAELRELGIRLGLLAPFRRVTSSGKKH